MEKTGVQKLAGVLRVLVSILFVCNLAAFFFVPGLVFARTQAWASLLLPPALGYFGLAWGAVWSNPYWAVLTGFLLFCGVCTAAILWQGRRVLNTILVGNPFCLDNAASLRRASVCCFLIAGAALARVIWGLAYYRSIASLVTYNALFVPLFALGGLLCLVVSALFRQAAELKAENDLTI